MYRIPKHVSTKFRVLGLDLKSGIIVAVIFIVNVFIDKMFPPTNPQALFYRLLIAAFTIGIPWVFLASPEIQEAIFAMFYHIRNSSVSQWESERDAITKELDK